MGIKRNYNLSHRLIAFVLSVGLFLQSCGGGLQNQVVPQGKKQPSRTITLSDHPLINTDKEFVTSGGYLASFYEDEGKLKADLKADEKQPAPNYNGVPVLVEKGTDLASLTGLDPATQKNRIELNRSHDGQLRHIVIRKGGLSGGMMEGDTEEANNESIPNECFCPITQEIMEDPVIAQDGHTYERIAIQSWFDRGGRISPKTGARLLNTELISNYSMRSLIQDLKAEIPALAKHKLEMRNIETAIKLREEQIQEFLELKASQLHETQEKVLQLEKQLAEVMRISQTEKETKPSEIIMFCGNSGVGKSTLCNSIFQKAEFNPSIKIGEGVTTRYQRYVHDNKLYIDTPGLDDVEMCGKVAEEIEKVLKNNDNYKIVFVARLESGRIMPADLATINTVCDAIKTNFKYGIIFNKVDTFIIQEINEKGLDQYLTTLHKKPFATVVLKEETDMKDEENVCFPMNSENRDKLIGFINRLDDRTAYTTGGYQGSFQTWELETKRNDKEKEKEREQIEREIKEEKEELRLKIDDYFFRHATKKNINWDKVILPDLSKYDNDIPKKAEIVAFFYKQLLYDKNLKYGGWRFLARNCYKRNKFAKLLSPEQMGFISIEPTCFNDENYNKQWIRYLRDGLLELKSIIGKRVNPFFAEITVENKSDQDIDFIIPKGQVMEVPKFEHVQNLAITGIIKFEKNGEELKETDLRLQAPSDLDRKLEPLPPFFKIKARETKTIRVACACTDRLYAPPKDDGTPYEGPAPFIHPKATEVDPTKDETVILQVPEDVHFGKSI